MNDTRHIVAFGKSAFIGLFPAHPESGGPFERDESVVIQTERGLETGRVMGKSAGAASHQRTIIRRFDASDEKAAGELRQREEALFGPAREWLHSALAKPLLDVELLFDRETALLHGFWNEDELKDELAADFLRRFALKPLFYDAASELVVEVPEPAEKSGCGTGGCSTGGCGSCGTEKSGCSSGSCSRGSFKEPDDLQKYLLSLREKMEVANARVALH